MNHEPVDYVLDYMKAEGIPLTRANYVEINWMGCETYESLGVEDRSEVDDLVRSRQLRVRKERKRSKRKGRR